MLTFTDRAREMVLSFMSQNEDDLQHLRISMQGGTPLSPQYELTLVNEVDDADIPLDMGDFSVLVERTSLPGLQGATVDFVERVNETGFEIRPATVDSSQTATVLEQSRTAGSPAPTGPLAEKIQGILDSQINPAIASHGGAIKLVDVKGTELYMEMLGGCQGCAMSRLTLRQGVERMIQQAVPEITAIHDVTDHSSGENPYFDAPM